MTRILTVAQVVWMGMLRRKDLYVLFILAATLLLLLVSLNIFGLGSVSGYVKDIGLLVTWVIGWILAIGVSARELPQEESRHTVYALLAKPVTRWDVVAGKWFGAWTVVSAATAAFYLLVAGVCAAAGGGGFAAVPLAQAFVLHAVLLGFICAVGLLFSTRLNYDAAATLTAVVTGAAVLVVPRVPAFLTKARGLQADVLLLLYNVLPHAEVFDLRRRVVHGYGPIPAGAFFTIVAYGAALTVAALSLAWLSYRRKRFTRGNIG